MRAVQIVSLIADVDDLRLILLQIVSEIADDVASDFAAECLTLADAFDAFAYDFAADCLINC